MFKNLGKNIKEFFLVTWQLWLVILFLYLGIRWDIYRWHTFQELTHSDIGYWKWHMMFGGNK